jgi:hypothetical protein
LTVPRKCDYCHEKNITLAYHTLCKKCATEKKVCEKCKEDKHIHKGEKEIKQENIIRNREEREFVPLQKTLKKNKDLDLESFDEEENIDGDGENKENIDGEENKENIDGEKESFDEEENFDEDQNYDEEENIDEE